MMKYPASDDIVEMAVNLGLDTAINVIRVGIDLTDAELTVIRKELKTH